jgi:hypothetical protein
VLFFFFNHTTWNFARIPLEIMYLVCVQVFSLSCTLEMIFYSFRMAPCTFRTSTGLLQIGQKPWKELCMFIIICHIPSHVAIDLVVVEGCMLCLRFVGEAWRSILSYHRFINMDLEYKQLAQTLAQRVKFNGVSDVCFIHPQIRSMFLVCVFVAQTAHQSFPRKSSPAPAAPLPLW